MKKLFLLSLIGIFLISCNSNITGEGSADLAQDYKISNFTKIEANGIFKLMLVESDSAYVSVQTHKNLIENMDISNSGNTLKIKEKKTVDGFESYEVYVYYNQPIEDIEIDGKILMQSAGALSGNDLNIETEKDTRVDQFNVNVKKLEVECKDNSEITLSGETTKLQVKAENVSVVNLSDLKSNVADINLSNEAKAKINVENELNGKISDNSILEYQGNPKKDVDVKDRAKIQNN